MEQDWDKRRRADNGGSEQKKMVKTIMVLLKIAINMIVMIPPASPVWAESGLGWAWEPCAGQPHKTFPPYCVKSASNRRCCEQYVCTA